MDWDSAFHSLEIYSFESFTAESIGTYVTSQMESACIGTSWSAL